MAPSDIKVSALMVGQNRPQIWDAIECFRQQTHPHRELVVVINDPDPAFREALAAKASELGNIHIHTCGADLALGALRNLSIEAATGQYLVQWDDDDLSAPTRIEWQLGKMLETGAKASYLRDYVHYFLPEDRKVVCHWHNGLPGTLMCDRSTEARYPSHQKTREDDAFKAQLRQLGIPIAAFDNDAAMFTYRYHGANTRDLDYHEGISRDHLML